MRTADGDSRAALISARRVVTKLFNRDKELRPGRRDNACTARLRAFVNTNIDSLYTT